MGGCLVCEPRAKHEFTVGTYSTSENADVGAWVLLEVEQEDARVMRSRRATTLNNRHTELSA